jgi:hypothetical protein
MTEHTCMHVPHTYLLPYVKYFGPGILRILVSDSESGRRPKPPGVHGFEVIRAILDAPPADWPELIRTSYATRSPLELSFRRSERGWTLLPAAG